jgi:aminoglycoside phosphotransferase family enzyme/predicted kinase
MSVAAEAARMGADPDRVRAAVAELYPADPVTVRETHISWVFLTRERAFKLKKPLVLSFLDYGTAARRRDMCREEVRLNARLARDVYLGVRAVADHGDRLAIAADDDPAAIDYLVEMRRYDEQSTLAALAVHCAVTREHVTAVGARLAAFHSASPVRCGQRGSVAVRHEVQENLGELMAEPGGSAAPARIAALGRFLDAFVAANRTLFDARARRGLIREGHGDLRAEHVIVAPHLSIVDCVEFDPGLRTLDVADDLAFLVMDLCALGADASARELIAAYRESGGDPGSDELVWFFAVHRALIRAKVGLVRAEQTADRGASPRADVDHLLGIAERCAWRARGPLTLVICGVPASGKSHLARAVAAAAGLPVISSDLVRKELAGLSAHERGSSALYQPEVSKRTYRELGRRAAMAITAGSGVLIDATFRRRADRDAFAEGRGPTGSLTFVQCLASAEVLRCRAVAREHDPHRASDATPDVVERERRRFDPLDDANPAGHLVLRTDRDTGAVLADLVALLDLRLAGDPVAAA